MDFNGIYSTGNIYIYVCVCSGYTCVCKCVVCVYIYISYIPTGKLAYHWKIIMLDR